MDYSAELLVVDTFSKQTRRFQYLRKKAEDLRPALEDTFKKMGKPRGMLYSDAELGLTAKPTQKLLKKAKHATRNIALKHAPVAERMIGCIKNHANHAIRDTNRKWWEVVDVIVNDTNVNHVNRNTLTQPNDAAKADNREKVKTQRKRHQEERHPPTVDRRGGQGQGRPQ